MLLSDIYSGIMDFFEMLFDNRFSWRFKIANWILGDDLRMNLALARSQIAAAIDSIKYLEKSPRAISRLRRAMRYIDELWKYPQDVAGE